MKTFVTVTAVMLGFAAGLSAQTNTATALYIHFGIETTDFPKRLLSSRIHLGEDIFLSGADYWTLTGRVERHGT